MHAVSGFKRTKFKELQSYFPYRSIQTIFVYSDILRGKEGCLFIAGDLIDPIHIMVFVVVSVIDCALKFFIFMLWSG